MFVVVYGLRLKSDVLLLCTHVVKNDHLHVQAVVSLLYQPLFVLLIDRSLNLLDQFLFNGLDMGLSLEDDIYGLPMLLHLAVNRRLVQIRRNDVILLFTVILHQQFFLQFKCVVDSPERDSKFL